MEALKKRMVVDHDGFIKVPGPPCFGKQVEIIISPVSYEQNQDESEYFECVAGDGTVYRLRDWTDDEFNKARMMSVCKDDNTTAIEFMVSEGRKKEIYRPVPIVGVAFVTVVSTGGKIVWACPSQTLWARKVNL